MGRDIRHPLNIPVGWSLPRSADFLSISSEGSREQGQVQTLHCWHLRAGDMSVTQRHSNLEVALSLLQHSRSAKDLPLVLQGNAIPIDLHWKWEFLKCCQVIQWILCCCNHPTLLLARDVHQISGRFLNQLLYFSLFIVLNMKLSWWKRRTERTDGWGEGQMRIARSFVCNTYQKKLPDDSEMTTEMWRGRVHLINP